MEQDLLRQIFPVGRMLLWFFRDATLAGALQSLWRASARASSVLLLILLPTPFHPVQTDEEIEEKTQVVQMDG